MTDEPKFTHAVGSKFNRPEFRYHGWLVTDAEKQCFTAQAALDTFVTNRIREMDAMIIDGKPYGDASGWLFKQFTWFLGANRLMQLVSAKQFANYVFLSEVLTYHFESNYYINLIVHHDGTVEEYN